MENKRRLSKLKFENFSTDESLAIRQCSMLVEVNFRETLERHEVQNEMITVAQSLWSVFYVLFKKRAGVYY